MMTGHISPADWGLPSSLEAPPAAELEALGLDAQDLEARCRHNTYEWLLRQYDEEIGAFCGHYGPRDGSAAEAQTANLIAPWQLIAAYDRFGDEELLARARRAADWVEFHLVEGHPMSLVLGGVRDHFKPNQLWTKYTADYVRLNLALWERTQEEVYLELAHTKADHAPCHEAAVRIADWHVEHQRPDGSWWLTVDASGVPASEYVGPGDVPNIAISLLYMHSKTEDLRYLLSALRAMHYSLEVQATPACGDPYLDDPRILWGFWSWQPYYDYTMSSDQSTHHVRGMWFFLDYFHALSRKTRGALVQAWHAYQAEVPPGPKPVSS